MRRTQVVHLVLVALFFSGCNGFISDAAGTGGAGGSGPGGTAVGADGAPLGAADIPFGGARRLSRAEIDNTLRDLVGARESLAATHLPEDDQEREGMFLHWPFDNAYPSQRADGVMISGFETIADAAAAQVASDDAVMGSLVPCVAGGADDTVCLRSFVEDFGLRAFRRPLESEEVDRFLTFAPFSVEVDDFGFGIELVIRAMLQSPDFLYRVEIGTPVPGMRDVYRLDGYEIATRMSYLLWGSAPDAWLLGLAESGELDATDGRAAAAEEMLDDPRAIAQVDRFHAQWLGYTTLFHSPELTTAMRDETRTLIERVIFEENLPYVEIFRFEQTHVSQSLAEHYGLPAPDGAEGWVDYGDSGRRGILAHGAALAGFATGGDTSVTRRGIFVRERLLCTVLPPPPPNVNADDIPETHCKSEEVAVHQQGACGGCHSQMDPIGWGLENFDLQGRFRAHDPDKPECPIDGAGELPGYGEFTGPGELGTLLVESGELESCVIRQVVRYAMGREENDEDMAFVDELALPRVGTGWTFRDLLVDLVASDRFALTRRDEASAAASATGGE
jgi:hypothetical protein